jgi:UDP-GlcNAc:undecaprenyl-phosphate/decaprenyl-phosphate GlcNAc-1-phosphate transferase
VLKVFFLPFAAAPNLSEPLVTPLLAFCLTALLMPFLNWVAVRSGAVDHPNARKIHARPIPMLGGVGVYLGVIAALWLRAPKDKALPLMMLASFLVMLLGVIDDRLDLHSRYRLLLHVALASGLSLCGIRFHFFPAAALDHGVTILWIVGVINAMNCLDCADGVAGATCVVVFAALAALAAANGRIFVCQAALAGAGALVGFLVYNAPPARVFLGDSGSTFLGLMAAVLAILANPHAAGHWHLPAAPFVLAVPVFDIAWVHYRRYRAGIRTVRDLLASAGKDHLPHRLMALGFTRPACMAMMTYLSVLAAAGVYGLAHGVWSGAALTMAALILFLWHLDRAGHVVIRATDQAALYEPHRGASAPEAPRIRARVLPEPE